MDWWLIPLGIAAAALLRFVWVAAFHPRETVSAVPELSAYVPVEPGAGRSVGRAGDATPTVRPSAVAPTTSPGRDVDSEPIQTDQVAPGVAVVETELIAAGDTDQNGGIWIELDITPLFHSSESRQIVDVTKIEDPEVTP